MVIGQIRTLKVSICKPDRSTTGFHRKQNYAWLANSAVWSVHYVRSCVNASPLACLQSVTNAPIGGFPIFQLIFPYDRLNLIVIFTSMGFVAHTPPNFAAALSSLGVPEGPVKTQLFATIPLFSQVS
jgi:hypothetical protein